MIYSMTAFARVETKKRVGLSRMGNTLGQPTLFRNLFSLAGTVSFIRASFT